MWLSRRWGYSATWLAVASAWSLGRNYVIDGRQSAVDSANFPSCILQPFKGLLFSQLVEQNIEDSSTLTGDVTLMDQMSI